jgi:hypothetical protein
VGTPTPQYRIDPNGVPDDAARGLFEAWVSKLSAERLGLTQQSSSNSSEGETTTFGDHLTDHFVVHWSGLDVTDVTSVGADEGVIQGILGDAIARVASHDTDTPVVYSTEMTLTPINFVADAAHFMRTLGDQVHIEGSSILVGP